jgi:hypothetical protein
LRLIEVDPTQGGRFFNKMSEKSNSSFQKARDKALRALVAQGSLTAEQVSGLKLKQLHLATGTLVVEPDEFAAYSASNAESINLKLDASMQRALIDWLVVRPDGPNDHLFPGTGQQGLDVATIREVVKGEKPAPAPGAEEAPDAKASIPVDPDAPKDLPEPLPSQSRPAEQKAAPAPTPPPPTGSLPEEPQAVPLDEIEALRKRLADAYDAWGPAVTPRRAQPPARESQPPAPRTEKQVPDGMHDWAPPPAPPATAPPEREEEKAVEIAPAHPAKPSPSEPETTVPEEEKAQAEPAVPAGPAVADRIRSLWQSSAGQLTLSYRALAIGGLTFLVVVCCGGVAIAGGMLLSTGGAPGLLAAATPSETALPTPASPMVTPTPSPMSTPTATSAPTPLPTPTFTPPPAATDTPAATPTPIIVVVTATPTPEPPATDTPVATNTPSSQAPPAPTATSAPAFKYPAPTTIEPKDNSVATGSILYLKWQPVGPLADDEWYAVRLIFNEQGQPVYEGDRTKEPEWLVPGRLYYKADGPELQYRWFVFVERQNADGSTSQLSPESQTNVFRWE